MEQPQTVTATTGANKTDASSNLLRKGGKVVRRYRTVLLYIVQTVLGVAGAFMLILGYMIHTIIYPKPLNNGLNRLIYTRFHVVAEEAGNWSNLTEQEQKKHVSFFCA